MKRSGHIIVIVIVIGLLLTATQAALACPTDHTPVPTLAAAAPEPGAIAASPVTEPGRSFFPQRPEDPTAVYFTPDKFNIKADGTTDVSDALQAAIREVKTRYNFGILFIPEGKYLLTKTIYVPTAVRLIGYGKDRPLFLLGKNSPGFQTADSADKGHAKYMFWFVNNLSGPGQPIYDAGASTFYSALSNINLRIGDGNPAAVALRTHFAQHSFIEHVDIYIGSGKAGLYDVGNEMEDVRFFGGDYGIYTTKPSPGWAFMMVDTWFEGQRRAAVRTREAGLTIVRMSVRNTPAVIDIDSNYSERLFMEDCRFDNIAGAAIRISDENNAFNQVNLRNIVCRNTPVLVAYKLSGRQVAGAGPVYSVHRLTDGLQMQDWQADPDFTTTREIEPLSAMPPPVASDIPAFPAMDTWANLQSLGAKGDGVTDDTKILQDAIDRYPAIYIPQGWYRISATLHLRPNTVLIGLNPMATQLRLADNAPAFGGFGGPVPLLETPSGGANIVSGIGLATGAGNARAVACKWMAGEKSYLDDVKFIGGHGNLSRPEHPAAPAAQNPAAPGNAAPLAQNATAPRSPRSPRPGDETANWDSQYWSLWITNGGGGTFKNIWTANTDALAGVYISHTTTPGRIYALSVEHHVRNEIRFNRVANWKVYALQLEEESRESSECQPMELQDCNDMVFANLYMFRVIRVNKPYPWSIRRWGGSHIELLNVHNYSQIKFTTTAPLYDVDNNTEIRPWEFARLYIGNAPAASQPAAPSPAAPAAAPTLRQLATGFEFAQSVCCDTKGNIYFCESRMRRIYRWSPASQSLSLIADYPWEPLSLACDQKDNLLVVFKYIPQSGHLVDGKQETFTNPADAAGTSFSGWGNSGFATWAYAISPDNPDETIQLLPKVPMGSVDPLYAALYPAHRWRDFHDFTTVSINRPQECFLAPDSRTVIPVVYDLARSTALAPAHPGQPMYTADEYDGRTVRLQVSHEGYLSDLKPFAERGEFASATDATGNVYIAAGQIYKYDEKGQQTQLIKVPERPTGITIDPKDPTILYITGHHSLYAVTSR
jgi:sugar lactone lactonase YvrE